MTKRRIISAFIIFALVIVSGFIGYQINNISSDMNNVDNQTSANALTDGEWKKVPVEEANINPFEFFRKSAVLSVGTEGDCNAMTIGWGGLGTIWGFDCQVVTVYVRQSRFTKPLMDKYETFTVETFPEEYLSVVNGYLGRVSGRDEDKMKDSGLTVKTMPCGAPAFEEGNVILECQKLSNVDIAGMNMKPEIVEKFYSKGSDKGDIHTAYIGKITAVWVKNKK